MEFSEQNYELRIADLFERHQSVQMVGVKAESYKPGLAGMQAFDLTLGSPWKQYRTIHVAGTNGKGSVCSLLAAALQASGLKVGLYTSPHLLDFRERIKVLENGECEMISRQGVWDFLEANTLDGLSFFEITTGMAFWWFAQQKVDVAVIEVGLGGRLDSTNIITPELSIITGIGLDHCAILGDSRAAIAGEKAGIFKAGVPALVWGHDSQTDGIFDLRAAAIGSPLYYANPDCMMLDLDLRGEYEIPNLRTVFSALDILGITPNDAIRSAISHAAAITGLRARWEKLGSNPDIICDIGHNPQALALNFQQLRETDRPLIIVYGVMADKDLTGIAMLMPEEASYILVAPATPRALPVDELQRRLNILRPSLITTTAPSVAEGISVAIACAHEDSIIYIGGSTFVAAEALKVL